MAPFPRGLPVVLNDLTLPPNKAGLLNSPASCATARLPGGDVGDSSAADLLASRLADVGLVGLGITPFTVAGLCTALFNVTGLCAVPLKVAGLCTAPLVVAGRGAVPFAEAALLAGTAAVGAFNLSPDIDLILGLGGTLNLASG